MLPDASIARTSATGPGVQAPPSPAGTQAIETHTMPMGQSGSIMHPGGPPSGPGSQNPPRQVPGVQSMPHIPQLRGSLARSASQPFELSRSQFANGGVQGVKSHVPMTLQLPVATGCATSECQPLERPASDTP